MVRVLQCVAASGVVPVVRSTNWVTSIFLGGAPRGRSRSIPGKRFSMKRSRQRATWIRPTPTSRAISWFCMPCAANRTIRARCAMRTLLSLERASSESCSRSGSLSSNLGATRTGNLQIAA